MISSAPAFVADIPVRVEPTEAGRRDRKKLATRQALRNAALQLVAERGFAHVTVEDIAEAADVSTRTFFNYFPTKESAVIGMEPGHVDRILANLLARPEDESPVDALRAVLVAHATSIAEELDDLAETGESWFRRLCVVREDPEMLRAYSAHVSEIERGLVSALAQRLGRDPASDAYPALVTATVIAAARVAALYWSAGGASESLPHLTATAIDRLAKGLDETSPFTVDAHTTKTSAPTSKRTRGTRP